MPSQFEYGVSESLELQAFLPPSSLSSVDSALGPEEATLDANTDPEREPLIQQASSSGYSLPPRHNYCGDPRQAIASSSHSTTPNADYLIPAATYFHSSDEASIFNFGIMEKVKNSRAAHWANKLSTKTEPGLTAAQLMLYNYDLKPVEPERRQWGAWNFVGFWVGMSLRFYNHLTSRILARAN